MSARRDSRCQQEHAAETHSARASTVVLGVLIAVLILSLWLHFIVAQQNEMIGREIQTQTEYLAQIERENLALRQQVAAMCAEPVMAERARALGYQTQQPLYLLLNRPLAPASDRSPAGALLSPSIYGRAPVAGNQATPTQTGSDSTANTAAVRP